MKNTEIENNIDREIDNYLGCARKTKCPPSMKQNLYDEIGLSNKSSFFASRYVMAGVSMAFVAALVLNISNRHHQQNDLMQAQADLQVAMHYMNRVSFKSLSAVNSKGVRPGLIKPLAKTYASL